MYSIIYPRRRDRGGVPGAATRKTACACCVHCIDTEVDVVFHKLSKAVMKNNSVIYPRRRDRGGVPGAATRKTVGCVHCVDTEVDVVFQKISEAAIETCFFVYF